MTISKPPLPVAPAATTPGTGPGLTGTARCYRSADLFGPAREVLIEHDSGYYRLRLTQANKLILTK